MDNQLIVTKRLILSKQVVTFHSTAVHYVVQTVNNLIFLWICPKNKSFIQFFFLYFDSEDTTTTIEPGTEPEQSADLSEPEDQLTRLLIKFTVFNVPFVTKNIKNLLLRSVGL